jgi:hypothetical protein
MKPLKRRYKVGNGFVGKRRNGKGGLRRPADHGKGAKL